MRLAVICVVDKEWKLVEGSVIFYFFEGEGGKRVAGREKERKGKKTGCEARS